MWKMHLYPLFLAVRVKSGLALAVIQIGWLSAVGVIQHLHRNIISSARFSKGGLDPNAELVRGEPFPVTLDCSTRWWWKIYVDNFDIGEIVGHGVAAEIIHTESLSQAVHRKALDGLDVPRATEKGTSLETVGIIMGSVIDGISGRAAPTLRKILGPRFPHGLAPRAATRLPPVAAESDGPLGV